MNFSLVDHRLVDIKRNPINSIKIGMNNFSNYVIAKKPSIESKIDIKYISYLINYYVLWTYYRVKYFFTSKYFLNIIGISILVLIMYITYKITELKLYNDQFIKNFNDDDYMSNNIVPYNSS